MDSIHTFMMIFEKAFTERNSNDLTVILKDSRKYFQNVSRDNSGLILSTLFSLDKGLLYFLENELNRSVLQKGFVIAIKEGFHLLEFVMEQFRDSFELYIIKSKNVCELALTIKCSLNIQKAACKTFNKLIELFKWYSIPLGETVKDFVDKFHLLDIKERSLVFSVLGTISKYNPEITELHEYSDTIFKHLRNDFKKQFKPGSMSQPAEIQLYLDAIADMLDELPTETKHKYNKEIYDWIKELSSPDKHQSKKVIMRSAIDLLSKHCHEFHEFIYQDYNFWYELFTKLAQEKNVHRECGQRALKSYYRTIGCTLKLKNSDEDRSLFLHFRSLFEKQLKTNHHLDPDTLRFIIYGYSQMAAPCKRYLGDKDVHSMYLLVIHCALPLCIGEDLEEKQLESICDYQEALSEIISHMTDLSTYETNVLLKLSTFLVKKFPRLPVTSQGHAVSSLINTINSIAVINKGVLEEFLHNLIHDGIIWSCSHTLLIDAEIQEELNNLEERPLCYKNYLPLWSQLVHPNKYKLCGSLNTVQDVVDSMIHTCIRIIDKLNLNTKKKEDIIFSDVSLCQTAINGADFRIFINMVDLHVDILSGLKSFLITNTIHQFLLKVISMSYKHPFVSGFYKLVHAIVKHVSNIPKEEIDSEILELLYKYFINVLNLITTFSNELLITCLYLILDTPLIYVEHIMDYTTPVFKIAFTMSLSDYELAYTALTTLEKWMSHLEYKRMKGLLQEIVPFLELFLQSKEGSTELLQDVIRREKKSIKRIIFIDNEKTLESFQRRVLLFIASLDTDVVTDFIYKKCMDAGATWDKKDLLKYTLPFLDVKVDIYLDKILPRLITLALNSGDRRTKVVACEALHSVVAIVLGKTSQKITSSPDHFGTIYMMMCPALLSLGCDSDKVVQQIFQPLMLQLTHWLSSRFMLRSSATMYLLDSLFKELSNDSNSSLREFSGVCLAEFTKWSIKQCDLKKGQAHEVINRITNFALHPAVRKRIAAAIAFNHLYMTLREDEDIVNVYWFEILYSFVKSFNGCNDISINNALDHVEKVLILKERVFNANDHERKKPHEFEGTTLKDAINWLFTQCACLDQHCRKKCMELIMNLSKYVKDFDSPKSMVQNYIQSYGIGALSTIILKDLKPKMENLTSSNLLPLLKAFDVCVWLMRHNLIDAKSLFTNPNSQNERIFNCARNFIHVINRIKIEKKDGIVILSKELEDLQTLQCAVVIAMLDFLQILLSCSHNVIPDFFLSKELCEVIFKCVMHPQVLGFDAKNIEITETLPSVIENLSNTILRSNNDSFSESIRIELIQHVDKHINDFFNLEEIVRSTFNGELKQYIKGLIILERCNILSQMYKNNQIHEDSESKVVCIFKALIKEQFGQCVYVNIKPSAMEYLECLIELFFTRYKPSMIRTLIDLIGNNTILESDSAKVTHGIHFLNTFENILFKYMLQNSRKTVHIMCDLLQGKLDLLFTIVERLLLFAQRHKKLLHNFIEDLANVIIDKFTVFERAVNNTEDRRQKLVTIFGIAVHLKQKPMDTSIANRELHSWILRQLIENSNLEYKIHILENFLVCLTSMTINNSPELSAILRRLTSDRLAICPNKLSKQSIEAIKVMNYFQTLLALLPVTRSVTVFEFILLFGAGFGKHLCNEKMYEQIQKYFDCIPDEYVVSSIEVIYKLFMDLSRSADERFDVLYNFFLPLFQFCKTSGIEQFFKRNINKIYEIISCNIVGTYLDIAHLIVSKICSYDLIAIMIAKLSIKSIHNIENCVTENTGDGVKIDNKFLQYLYSNTLHVRTLKILTSDPQHTEMMRLLRCSAYNCSIAIVCLKEDENAYLSIFAENEKQGQLIWENIIDCNKCYNFQQTFKEYPKYCKKLINIRNCIKGCTVNRYSYIHTYDLLTSTLNEDINGYDLNKMTVHNEVDKDKIEERMSLTFEFDDLNNHECMASICGVLKHISEKITASSTENNMKPPKWLLCFCKSLMATKHNNVRLFMLKIILNEQAIFKPHAKFLLLPMIRAVYLYLETNNFNYIVTDVLMVFVDWHTTTVPSKHNETEVAQRLWERLICKVMLEKNNNTSKVIYRYNINLIKMLLEVWHTCMKLPTNLSSIMECAPGAAVYLILICLMHGMQNEILKNNDIFIFLEKQLENWEGEEKTILQSCECLGLILKVLAHDETLTTKKCEIIEKIQNILRRMPAKNRQMKCIRSICQDSPEIAMNFVDFATINIHKVDAQEKAYCLEIFLMCVQNFSPDKIKKELGYMKFYDLLTNRIPACERIALEIIDALVSILPSSDLLSAIKIILPYVNNYSLEYRDNIYNIFISIYKRYVKETYVSTAEREIMLRTKEILLCGLLDPSEKLQEKLLNFWTQDGQLANTCKDRLLEILNMYVPNVGDNFLSFTLLMMLDLTTKSEDCMQKLFDPLHECTYRQQNITLTWKTKNIGSVAPLFAPSLASEINQTFTHSMFSNFPHERQLQSSISELELLATEEPEFELTLIDDEPALSSDNPQHVNEFKIPTVPDVSYNKRSRRFLLNSSEITSAIRQKEIKKNMRRMETIQDQRIRQRNTVKLYRTYRSGDFPDIEISHYSFNKLLQELAKKDKLICKDLLLSVMCSLLQKNETNNFLSKVTEKLKSIIENHQTNNFMIAVVLEILLVNRITDFPSEVIAKASRLSGQNFLGTLVLEENLIYAPEDLEPPRKKSRTENVTHLHDKWLQLISLYESLNDSDVILSICQSQIRDEDVQEASIALSCNNWDKARIAYQKAYERETGSVKEYCAQGLFECLNNLCCWTEIDKHIRDKLNGCLDNIWDNAWKDWMFPWLFESFVRTLLDNCTESFINDLNIIQHWLDDKEKLGYIKRFFGDELAMFFINDKPEVSCDFLTTTLDEMRQEWNNLHPLSTQLRIQKLQKIRIINDINVFLKMRKGEVTLANLKNLLKLWTSSTPSAQDVIVTWDKLISYRMYFASLLSTSLDTLTEISTQNDFDSNEYNEPGNGVLHQLQRVLFDMQLSMIESSLNQKNTFMAQKYLNHVEKEIKHCPIDLKNRFLLTGAKLKCLNGELDFDMKKKMSFYASSWKHAQKLLQMNKLNALMNIDVRQHLSKLASTIAHLSQENSTFAHLLRTEGTILKDINAENNDIDKIANLLEDYSWNQLKICCDTTSTNIKECYVTLSKFCYHKLSRFTKNSQLQKDFISSTLRAMSYGSLEAAHYFPCLLMPEYFEDIEIQEMFIRESNGVQTWLFLTWQDQLFAHLGSSIAPLVIPILERIVKAYPNAVLYTFRLLIETHPNLLTDSRTYEIRQIFFNRPEIEKFLIAIQYVVQPELYLRYYVLEALNNLSLGIATAIDNLLKAVYLNIEENNERPRPGKVYEVIAKYQHRIKELQHKKPEEVKGFLSRLADVLTYSPSKRENSTRLKDYSPWLCKLFNSDLEIPGQYSGKHKPMPQHHAKIIRIEPVVKVMQSLRRPIRITIVGNDAKEYRLLVKFGEDLRLDQRLQQLFIIMNETLRTDAACRQRGLQIDTYQVIPLSKTGGLIQWIDNTRSLQDLIYFTLSKERIDRYNSIRKEYETWIANAAPHKSRYQQYKEAVLKYNATTVNTKMSEYTKNTEWDSLRTTVKLLCSSVECFVTIRRNFITSYATMCIAHWILGIGDRHLENILFTIESGRCLGIDFSLAFGAGIDQRIPELMPFRLTSQILGLLKPMDVGFGLLSTIMINTLNALRKEYGSILACLQVFVYEPLNWVKNSDKFSSENEPDTLSAKWLPKQKVSVVLEKLNGIKPSIIMLEELKNTHNDKYFDRYYAIVTGNDDVKQIRATIKDNNLTSGEQVKCLLDQAMDFNILGRTAAGWQPWL